MAEGPTARPRPFRQRGVISARRVRPLRVCAVALACACALIAGGCAAFRQYPEDAASTRDALVDWAAGDVLGVEPARY